MNPEKSLNRVPSSDPSPAKQAVPVGKNGDDGEAARPQGWLRWVWIAIALVSGIYIFIPEFTDAFPIVGWIDEGVAVLVLTTALDRLGLRIPLLHRFLGSRKKKK